jgi:hypothetical protein
MAHEDKGHYAKKHSPNRKVDSQIADAVKQRASGEEITCAAAHEISTVLHVSPEEVGFTADFLEYRIVNCQLGLFGYKPIKKVVKPAETVSDDLGAAIKAQLDNERLSCKAAWEIARNFKIPKMSVSSACECLEIKISPCQLGAFRKGH